MTSKIIIHNNSRQDDICALGLVQNILSKGNVSETAGRKHPCHITTWELDAHFVCVHCISRKEGTLTFKVEDYER